MSKPLDATQIAAVASAEKLDPTLIKTISDAAVRHDVDPMLLLAVGKQETDFGRSPLYDASTGTGDGGNGYGIFQLDKNTPSHVPNLPLVAHDNAKAADIAAGMMREALDHSKGDPAGALRYYNSGSIHGTTARADFHGHRVPYETAVLGYEDQFRSDVGKHTGVEPPHRPPVGSAVAPHDQRNTAEFIRSEHILRVVDGQGHVHEFPAYNNTTNPNGDPNVVGSHGPAPDGSFPLRAIDTSMANGENGSYGPVGAIPIGGASATARGLMIHSGRADDPAHPTYGCIRTTDAAMRFMRDNPPTEITIEETRSRTQILVRPGSPTQADQALVNSRIADVADKLYGMSTRDAQTHHSELENGNLACAYSVNKVLETALGRTYGASTESVPSVMADLRRHGKEIAAADVQPGDIAIKLPSHGEGHGHIGIVTQGGPDPIILNNSSSRGSFTNQDTPAQFSYNYVTHQQQDQVIYLRIDPNSVDLAKLRETPIPEKLLGPNNAPPSGPLAIHAATPGASQHVTPTNGKLASEPSAPSGRHAEAALPAWHVSGETRDGVLVESKAVLDQKNALLQLAIEGAKNGQTPAFAFAATAGESKRTVEMQNQFLDRAVAMHLPPAERAAFCKEKGIDLGREITGQKGPDGKPIESPAELEAKNAKLQKAIVLAQHGIVDRFPFKGDGKESPETVKAQNDLLQAAIRENLPASQAREGNAQEPTTRKEQLDSAIEKFNAENPNRPLPAARDASDWDKSRPLAGTMLELGKGEYAVNLGRGSYAYVESNQLASAPPAPNTYVEIGRDGSVNAEREIAMTQPGR